MKGYEINVHHITRVEGHGNIVVNVKDGKIEDLRLEIVESPRFFEAMLEGRKWDEAASITARRSVDVTPAGTETITSGFIKFHRPRALAMKYRNMLSVTR